MILDPADRPESLGAGTQPGVHIATSAPSASRQDDLGTDTVHEVGPSTWRLPADVESTGEAATQDVETLQGMPTVVEIPQIGRPSYPLPVTADGRDSTYAEAINETYEINQAALVGPHPIAMASDRPLLTERSRGRDDRPSTMSLAMDRLIRPFDKLLGAWPWSGEKAAQERPTAALPTFYGEMIRNPVPSPGGYMPTIANTAPLTPQPLTFRLAPEPWDSTFTVPEIATIPGTQRAGR